MSGRWTKKSSSSATEGMWPHHGFPLQHVNETLGTSLDADWLDRVRLGSVKLYSVTTPYAGSAAVVSEDGLLATCHHCVASALAFNSGEKDLLASGWLGRTFDEELRCPTHVADVLIHVENITEKVRAVRSSPAGGPRKSVHEAVTDIEREFQQSIVERGIGNEFCSAVAFYGGTEFWLYRYRRYSDVRIVFAPENDIAAFGGDTDNFEFPRWTFDVAFARLYEDGKPARTPNFLPASLAGPVIGEPVFVSGHPMSTERRKPVAELVADRRFDLVRWLLLASELRGRYHQFSKRDAAAEQAVDLWCRSLENWIKIKERQLDTLLDPQLLGTKDLEENEIRHKATEASSDHADAWEQLEAIQSRREDLEVEFMLIEKGVEWGGRLARYARMLVRSASEQMKPDNLRQREYADAGRARLERALGAPIPVHPEVEVLELSFWLERLSQLLGPNHSLVKTLFGDQTPSSLARQLVAGTSLGEPETRLELWRRGQDGLLSTGDTLIEFMKGLEPHALNIRDRYHRDVQIPTADAREQIEVQRAKFEEGPKYPDATATLRLSFGRIEGWMEGKTAIHPKTTLGQAFDRSGPHKPFRMPESWASARRDLAHDVPINFCSSNEIVAGNSGSPVLNAEAQVVGIVFDGNVHSISANYRYDGNKSRCVSVDFAGVAEALEKIYGAGELLSELRLGKI